MDKDDAGREVGGGCPGEGGLEVSKADKLFVSMCEDIIANGFSTEEGQEE